MTASMMIKGKKLYLEGITELKQHDISICFYPLGIVIKDGIQESPYAIPIERNMGICKNEMIVDMLKERGLIPEEQYPLIFLSDGYYEIDPHKLV